MAAVFNVFFLFYACGSYKSGQVRLEECHLQQFVCNTEKETCNVSCFACIIAMTAFDMFH